MPSVWPHPHSSTSFWCTESYSQGLEAHIYLTCSLSLVGENLRERERKEEIERKGKKRKIEEKPRELTTLRYWQWDTVVLFHSPAPQPKCLSLAVTVLAGPQSPHL